MVSTIQQRECFKAIDQNLSQNDKQLNSPLNANNIFIYSIHKPETAMTHICCLRINCIEKKIYFLHLNLVVMNFLFPFTL